MTAPVSFDANCKILFFLDYKHQLVTKLIRLNRIAYLLSTSGTIPCTQESTVTAQSL